VVTGPIGVGKTTVLQAADAIVLEADSPHATVELEELSRGAGPTRYGFSVVLDVQVDELAPDVGVNTPATTRTRSS
jgi:hypothetical protein